jgi:hypothetical protein
MNDIGTDFPKDFIFTKARRICLKRLKQRNAARPWRPEQADRPGVYYFEGGLLL